MKFSRKAHNKRKDKNFFLGVKAKGQRSWLVPVQVMGQALVGCGALAVILLVGWRAADWLLDRLLFENPSFRIERVEIFNDGQIAPDLIKKWSGIKEGQNLLALDLSRVKRDLELVQWIESVGVERHLPDTVRITIDEHETVARVHALQPADGGYRLNRVEFLVSGTSYVTTPVPGEYRQAQRREKPSDQLPLLLGVPVNRLHPGKKLEHANVKEAVSLIQAFQESPMFGLVRLESVRVDSDSILTLKTQQGSEIIFHSGDFGSQFNRWRLIHDAGRREGLGVLSTLDLSITNHVPATWQQSAPQSGSVNGFPYNPKLSKESNV